MGGPGVNFKFKTDWILFDGEKLANESVGFLLVLEKVPSEGS